MSQPAPWTLNVIKIGVLIMAVTFYFTVPEVHYFFVMSSEILYAHHFHELKEFILSYGVWAPMMSICLMTVQSLFPFVPGLAITIANAWIFGWLWGSFYSWTGSLVGAALDFGIARWYGHPVVKKFVSSKYLDRLNTFFETYGLAAIALARLTPVVPYKVVSYGAGFTTLAFSKYLFATGFGQTPAILLYSYLGQNITRSLHGVIFATSLFLLILIVLYVYREAIEKYFFRKSE
ncbi:putative membrane protein YdjX (TVP38/TMEM64 family) [Sporomusaceae bacterium BoRhaA]|uniref:TVP38/TMEM64 family protein n=1 Tax=Pelorhabdus rhamnosifermentans TaxID=2772457 RepID=UPI001FEB22E4|nr:TVP38/TMEM64 family protein [Pelorhabdus rhamnosifermentans]MBU2700230.1 putative membrane protein YdjX (TVP38/TMEM64 family) [Pelorhabdus rhamnosifermentans]